MTDQTNAQTADNAAAVPTETLEDIAAKFAPSGPQTPPQQVSRPAPADPMPDPALDPTGYAKWSASQNEQVRQELGTVSQKLAEWESQRTYNETMSDLKGAVETLSEAVDVPKKWIEGAIHVEYQNNPAFKTIWDNRSKNPAAYKRALAVLGQNLAKEASVKRDPQLTENLRAVKETDRALGQSEPKTDKNERFKKMNPAEFEREWERMKQG